MNERLKQIPSGVIYIAALYSVLSVAFFCAYIQLGFYNGDGHTMIAFTEDRPFVYRTLIPAIVRELCAVSSYEPAFWFDAVTLISALAIPWAMRGLLREWFSDGEASLMALLVFPALYCNFLLLPETRFPWDLPTIWLFTLGLLYMHRFNWVAFAIVFILAVINRETSILLISAFVVLPSTKYYKDKMYAFAILRRVYDLIPRFNRSVGIIAQLIFFGLWSLFVHRVFAHNGGAPVDSSWLNNLHILRRAYHGSTEGIAIPWICAGYYWLIPVAWSIKPLFVKRLMIVLLVSIAANFYAGTLVELRIWSEALVILTVSAAFSLRYLTQSIMNAPNMSLPPR